LLRVEVSMENTRESPEKQRGPLLFRLTMIGEQDNIFL